MELNKGPQALRVREEREPAWDEAKYNRIKYCRTCESSFAFPNKLTHSNILRENNNTRLAFNNILQSRSAYFVCS